MVVWCDAVFCVVLCERCCDLGRHRGVGHYRLPVLQRGGREGGLLREGRVGWVGRGHKTDDVERRTLYFVGLTEGDGVGMVVGTYVGFEEGSRLGCALGAAVGV